MNTMERELDLLLLGDSSATIGWGRYAGIYRVATEAREAGFQVKTVDHFISILSDPIWRVKLERLIIDLRPRYVGISSTFLKRYNLRTATGEKEINEVFAELYDEAEVRPFGVENFQIRNFLKWLNERKIKLIVGGSEIVDLYLDFPIDYVVVGQGEVSILEILSEGNPSHKLKVRQSKNSNISIVHQDDHKYSNFVHSKIRWYDDDQIFYGESLPIELARGCIFKCSFCNFQLNGKSKNDFVKTAHVLKEELLENYERFGITDYTVADDLLNDSIEKVQMLCDVSQSLPFRLSFSSYLRLDLLWANPGMISLLKEAGLRACYFGIETFNDRAGRAVGKGLGEKRIKKTLEDVRKAWGTDVWTSAGFIIGLPSESFASCDNTISWLLEKGSPIDFFKIAPLIVFKPDQASSQIFGQRADQLGYTLTEGRFFARWKNSEMTFLDAIKYCENFYREVETRKWAYAHFCTYNRIKNLGYTFDAQMLDVMHSDLKVRQKETIHRYLERALDAGSCGPERILRAGL
jgi:radical SAM superfamily enzyme YgiQ (UPF0313 family)